MPWCQEELSKVPQGCEDMERPVLFYSLLNPAVDIPGPDIVRPSPSPCPWSEGVSLCWTLWMRQRGLPQETQHLWRCATDSRACSGRVDPHSPSGRSTFGCWAGCRREACLVVGNRLRVLCRGRSRKEGSTLKAGLGYAGRGPQGLPLVS